MDRERLERLADKLEGVGPYADCGPLAPEALCNAHHVIDDEDWEASQVTEPHHDWRVLVARHSGLEACVISWCALDPWFVARGLSLVPSPIVGVEPCYHPTGARAYAASDFFDISNDESTRLFGFLDEEGVPRAVGPADYAARLREFLSQGA